MPSPKKPLLLDTHAWVWSVHGNLRAEVLKPMNEPFLLHAISVWEVAMLVSKKRLELFPSVEEWVRKYLVPPLILLPLSPAIALLANALPGSFHADPADRIIMASALIMDARLVTADKKMLRYAKTHGLKTLPLD